MSRLQTLTVAELRRCYVKGAITNTEYLAELERRVRIADAGEPLVELREIEHEPGTKIVCGYGELALVERTVKGRL